jgi:hypothetical protein
LKRGDDEGRDHNPTGIVSTPGGIVFILDGRKIKRVKDYVVLAIELRILNKKLKIVKKRVGNET